MCGIRVEKVPPQGFGKRIISVSNKKGVITVPQLGSIVLCRVIRITSKFAQTLILTVESTFLPEPFPGSIRKQDIRQTETDKLEMNNCFRPGDIVRAKVV